MLSTPRQVRIRRCFGCAALLGCGVFVSCSESGPESTNSTETSSDAAATAAVTTAANSTGNLGTTAAGTEGTLASGSNGGAGGATLTSGTTGGGAATTGSSAATTGSSAATGSSTGGGGGATTTGGGGATSGAGGTATEIDPEALFAAPDGTPGAAGTIEGPTTFSDALERAEAGTTIYLRGGTYTLDSTHTLDADGSDGSPIQLSAYPLDTERPLLDFSNMAEDSSNRGLSLSGDYWHVYGLDVFGAGDNCMFVSGSHNVIEHSTFSECADTGLQLGNGASDNLILNCDSYYNADSSLENADGFAAKLDVGTGNGFVGCRAWNNLDDGWDGYLRPADDVTTTHENCWAIDNGKLQDGSVGAGDGNGFKTGGSDDKDLRHNASYIGCIATGNVNDGFDHNSNRGSVTILNSAAHDNGNNINFSTTNIAASLTLKNTLSLGTNGDLSATSTDITNNSWQDGRAATADDFVSIDPSALKGPRQSDGSLPEIDYLRLAPGSDLRNAGVDIGLPYEGSAPDIGPFESED